MNIRFDGKTAVITGASRGIGFGCASVLADCGADIIIGDINAELGEAACKKLEAKGVKAKFMPCDVTNVDQVSAMMDAAPTLDIVINSAGMNVDHGLLEASQESVKKTMEVNAVGSAIIVREAIRRMIPREQGKIVLISSLAGRIDVSPELAHYGMSKAAVQALLLTAAKVAGPHNININSILPGFVRTQIWEDMLADDYYTKGRTGDDYWAGITARTPMRRTQTPEDIGYTAAFLCSEYAKNICGQGLSVCGGYLLRI